MSTYEEISEARKILGLSETAALGTIKSNFRSLIARWHPDKCKEDKAVCAEMTRRVISAYQTIMDYCLQYQFSFSEDTVKRHQSYDEWWRERFGEDFLFGKAGPPK